MFLDSEILRESKEWLKERDLSEKTFKMCRYGKRIVTDDLKLARLSLESVARQLEEEQKEIKMLKTIQPEIASYRWHEPKTGKELAVAKKLEQTFERVMSEYPNLIDSKHQQIETLYWSALKAGIIEEKDMVKLYEFIHTDPHFPSTPWFHEESKSTRSMLVKMLQSDRLEVSRLAAVSLSAIYRRTLFPHEPKRIEDIWVGEKYWKLAQDKKDIWHLKYIEGMACCQLKWAEHGQKWLKTIKEANTAEARRAWCKVIEESGYCEAEDRDAFFHLLLHILELGDAFAKSIRFAALRRLDEIVSEMEPVGFDERPLNLPLSRR